MKTGKLFLMILAVLLGMAVAAPAITLHSPCTAGPHEADLYQNHAAWGFSTDNHPSRHATPWESLSADTFSMHHYALNLRGPRSRGMHHWPQWIPERHFRSHDHGFHWFTPRQSRNWGWDRTSREASHFGFFEAFQPRHTFLNTPHHNSPPSHHHWADSLISALGELNPLYVGEYLITFEPGGNNFNFGCLGGNFLVVKVYRLDNASPVPLPGTLPLLGGGLAGLGILRSYRRRSTSAG